MFSFSGPTSLPEFDFGPPHSSDSLHRHINSEKSWETRRLRKHRRLDDEGCSAKKRRLMPETDVDILENNCSALSAQQVAVSPPQPCSALQTLSMPQPSSVRPQPEKESSCMEIEAAHRKLQEIENRIILEDDDEDLDLEPAPRRPVLVISDSLKEGLQRGLSDILPQTVAQSVKYPFITFAPKEICELVNLVSLRTSNLGNLQKYLNYIDFIADSRGVIHLARLILRSPSGMELVLWRPPEDPFCQRLKDSLQKQRKQTVSRQIPTPCTSPTPPLSPSSPPAETCSPMHSFPVLQSSAEEEMEI